MVFTDPKTKLGRMKLWVPEIKEVAAATGESKERLMALLWRESRCTFAPGYSPIGNPVGWGDKGFAFGPFQIDRRYHFDFIIKELGKAAYAEKFGPPYRPTRQALYACDLLRQNREWLKRSSTSMAADILERAVYAAYNAGPARVLKAVQTRLGQRNGPPLEATLDSVTTGGDYSKYIFGLASILQKPDYNWLWE